MDIEQDIINYIMENSTHLKEKGYNSITINKRKWMASIDYCSNHIAIEYELDWRERTIFCLIVKLDNGKLPNGYYVNDDTGKKCRWNLEYFLIHNNILYDKTSLNEIEKLSKHTKLDNRDCTYIKKMFNNYKVLLTSCLNEIENANVFNKDND